MSTIATTERPARIFGVCATIGEDFGFNPDWLRVAFAIALLFSLEGVLAAYAVIGLIVLASRLLFPEAKAAVEAPARAAAEPDAPGEIEWREAA